jgi:hypothetical protein
MSHEGTNRALTQENIRNAKAHKRYVEQNELKVGDRVMDTLIKQRGTITKIVKSAIMPDWTVAVLLTYDEAPPMEYNMATKEGMQFTKHIKQLKR